MNKGKKKISLFIPSLNGGGAEKVVLNHNDENIVLRTKTRKSSFKSCEWICEQRI